MVRPPRTAISFNSSGSQGARYNLTPREDGPNQGRSDIPPQWLVVIGGSGTRRPRANMSVTADKFEHDPQAVQAVRSVLRQVAGEE
jgi:hypothetical protein